MTRSKRKTPRLAITCAESEKGDKRIAARRERARITSKLSVHAASEPDFDLVDTAIILATGIGCLPRMANTTRGPICPPIASGGCGNSSDLEYKFPKTCLVRLIG